MARRSIWFLSLAPAAFVLVMGYAESLLLVLGIGCFLVIRRGAERPQFGLAVLFGFFAALARPSGIFLALAIAVELVRWWGRLEVRQRAVGVGAVVAPVLGVGAFLGWADHVSGDFWAPLRVQLQSSHHGGLSDPFVTLFNDARGILHHHVGTALHVPWVIVALVLLVVCWRRLAANLHGVGGGHLGLGGVWGQPRLLRALWPERLPPRHCGSDLDQRRQSRAGGLCPLGRGSGRIFSFGVLKHFCALRSR